MHSQLLIVDQLLGIILGIAVTTTCIILFVKLIHAALIYFKITSSRYKKTREEKEAFSAMVTSMHKHKNCCNKEHT